MTQTATVVSVTELADGTVNVQYDDNTGSSFIDRQALEDEVNRRLANSANSLIWLCLNKYLVTNTFPVTAIMDTDDANGNVVKVT